jgi:hypothetical protein
MKTLKLVALLVGSVGASALAVACSGTSDVYIPSPSSGSHGAVPGGQAMGAPSTTKASADASAPSAAMVSTPPPLSPDTPTAAFSPSACPLAHAGAPGYSGLPRCVGTQESEPNDGTMDASVLDQASCGKLDTGTDVDTFTFVLDKPGTWIGLAYNSLGDATLTLVAPDGTEVLVPPKTPYSTCAAAAGTYYVRLASPGQTAQEYAVSFSREN